MKAAPFPAAALLLAVIDMQVMKAGELCEPFNELHLIDGSAVVATAPTTGRGQCLPMIT
jgi:hypothetical protein